MFRKFILTFSIMTIFASSVFAQRTITDQNGRKVSIADKIERIVVLQHQSLNVLVQLNATHKIVGVLQSWQKQLGENYINLAPNLKNLPTPGDLKNINYEQILKINPDVVIVANYIPQEFIHKMQELKIPVVCMSFFKNSKNSPNSLNPKFKDLKDEEIAYTQGLYEGIELLGTIANKEQNAKELISHIKKNQEILATYTAKIPNNNRVKLYMANPNFTTYGSGKYTNIIFSRAGGINVAANDIKGYKQISPEKLISYNPDVIFAQERYPQVIDGLKQNISIKNIKAIKNNKIYLMPQYAKAWGFPTPEAMGIGEFWVMKKLYPKITKDLDIDKLVQEYYHKFYRTDFK